MNLYRMLLQREADDEPLRVGLIGAGKFGSMFLSQVRKTTGMHLLAVADLRPDQEIKPSEVKVGYCAHCQTTRARKKYIFVKSATGEIKLVGSTCVKDF